MKRIMARSCLHFHFKQQTVYLIKECSQMSMAPRTKQYHVISKKAAVSIASTIRMLSEDPESPILESCPGRGLLTRLLLRKNKSVLLLFEDRKPHFEDLQEIKRMHQSRIEIIEDNIFSVFAPAVHSILEKTFTDKGWSAKPAARMVAYFAPKDDATFIRKLIQDTVNDWKIFSKIRFEFYIVLSPSFYKEITSTPDDSEKCTRYTVLTQAFFDISFISKLKRSYFKPVLPRGKIKDQIDFNEAYFVKVVPKADLRDSFGSLELLRDFHFFVSQNFQTTKHVIPTLEKWIPGCGPTFIKNGFFMFSTFKHISSLDLIKLFKIFSSLEEYPTSNFKNAVQTKLLIAGGESIPEELED